MKIKLGWPFWEGGMISLLGSAILILLPYQIKKPLVSEAQIPPSFLPMITGIGLLVTGVAMIIRSYCFSSQRAITPFKREEVIRFLWSLALLFLYSISFSRIGFIISSSSILGAFAYFFGARNWLKIFLNMSLIPLIMWFLLEIIFSIPLPRGLIF